MLDLENATLANDDYRRVVWTGERLQIVLMSLEPGETIDTETHPNADQFIRVEDGGIWVATEPDGWKFANRSSSFLKGTFVGPGQAFVVPAGTTHTVHADDDEGAKLYTLYAPPQHPAGRTQKKKPLEHEEDQ